METYFDREEDREPWDHALGVGTGFYAEHHVLVQHRVKVAGETMEHTVRLYLEGQRLVPWIVDDFICNNIFVLILKLT